MNYKKTILFSFILVFFVFVTFANQNVELKTNNLKLVLYSKTGSFCLFKLSDVGINNYLPLFDNRTVSSSSYFSVLFNGNIHKLQKKIGKPVEVESDETSASYIFRFNDDFQVKQKFYFEDDENYESVLVIDTTVYNTSGKEANSALKFFVDTNLGEKNINHFYLSTKDGVLSEKKITPRINFYNFILSQDKEKSLIFSFDKKDASIPKDIYFANWDRLNTKTWLPRFVEGRNFNTIYSVNDSALLFVWDEKDLDVNDSFFTRVVIGGTSNESLAWDNYQQSVSEKVTSVKEGKLIPSYEEKIKLLEEINQRIEEIEKNPDLATENELFILNEALDELLLE